MSMVTELRTIAKAVEEPPALRCARQFSISESLMGSFPRATRSRLLSRSIGTYRR